MKKNESIHVEHLDKFIAFQRSLFVLFVFFLLCTHVVIDLMCLTDLLNRFFVNLCDDVCREIALLLFTDSIMRGRVYQLPGSLDSNWLNFMNIAFNTQHKIFDSVNGRVFKMWTSWATSIPFNENLVVDVTAGDICHSLPVHCETSHTRCVDSYTERSWQSQNKICTSPVHNG